jgi:hypothetical protein
MTFDSRRSQVIGLRERTLIVFEGGTLQERAAYLLLGLRKKTDPNAGLRFVVMREGLNLNLEVSANWTRRVLQ